eukprot:2842585-Prymnesium_polylepis.1
MYTHANIPSAQPGHPEPHQPPPLAQTIPSKRSMCSEREKRLHVGRHPIFRHRSICEGAGAGGQLDQVFCGTPKRALAAASHLFVATVQ